MRYSRRATYWYLSTKPPPLSLTDSVSRKKSSSKLDHIVSSLSLATTLVNLNLPCRLPETKFQIVYSPKYLDHHNQVLIL